MRHYFLLLALLLAACSEERPPKPPPGVRTRAPIGFVGQWVQIKPDSLRGDTLTLRSDFTASGLVPLYSPDSVFTVATRWKIQFTSRDPLVARRDWYGHRDDGGDASCAFAKGTDTTCISGPLLCVGDTLSFNCVAFRFSAESLSLSTGASYVRAAAGRGRDRVDDSPGSTTRWR